MNAAKHTHTHTLIDGSPSLVRGIDGRLAAALFVCKKKKKGVSVLVCWHELSEGAGSKDEPPADEHVCLFCRVQTLSVCTTSHLPFYFKCFLLCCISADSWMALNLQEAGSHFRKNLFFGCVFLFVIIFFVFLTLCCVMVWVSGTWCYSVSLQTCPACCWLVLWPLSTLTLRFVEIRSPATPAPTVTPPPPPLHSFTDV